MRRWRLPPVPPGNGRPLGSRHLSHPLEVGALPPSVPPPRASAGRAPHSSENEPKRERERESKGGSPEALRARPTALEVEEGISSLGGATSPTTGETVTVPESSPREPSGTFRQPPPRARYLIIELGYETGALAPEQEYSGW